MAGRTIGHELDHVDAWPDKKFFQDAAVKAIRENRSVRFFWDLTDEPNELNVVEIPEVGDIIFRFHSPRWKLRHVAPDNVAIDV